MQLLLRVFVFVFYKLLYWSWRIDIDESPEFQESMKNREPLILAFWHQQELVLIHLIGRYKLCTMVSTSKDGSIMDWVVQRLGGVTTRGSSTRGAVQALKGLVRLVRDGHPACIAVDGPKGPIFEVKPGVFELSRLADAKVFPIGGVASRAHVFEKAWNKARLPLPFSRISICIGRPIQVGRDTDPRDAGLALQLKTAIVEVSQIAGKQIAN